MQTGDWFDTVIFLLIGLLLGSVVDGLVQLVADGFWLSAVIITLLCGGLFLLMEVFEKLTDPLFSIGVRLHVLWSQNDDGLGSRGANHIVDTFPRRELFQLEAFPLSHHEGSPLQKYSPSGVGVETQRTSEHEHGEFAGREP